MEGWYADTSFWSGDERVSRGMEAAGDGFTTKQSSMSGSDVPRVNGTLASMSGYEAVWVLVGMPSSSGRYAEVQRVTTVSWMVGRPLRLKYLPRAVVGTVK